MVSQLAVLAGSSSSQACTQLHAAGCIRRVCTFQQQASIHSYTQLNGTRRACTWKHQASAHTQLQRTWTWRLPCCCCCCHCRPAALAAKGCTPVALTPAAAAATPPPFILQHNHSGTIATAVSSCHFACHASCLCARCPIGRVWLPVLSAYAHHTAQG